MEILKADKIKSNISLLLFLFINLIFSIKYLSRVTNFAVPISLGITSFYFLIFKYQDKLQFFGKQLKIVSMIGFLILCIASCLIFQNIPVETLNVDRWSVITSFWDNYFADEYVYFALSHMNNYPGPMPFYYIAALPFYLLGELGYLSIIGLLVFIILLKVLRKPLATQTAYFIIIATSPFFLWEIVARSNIFFNSTLILISIVYFFKTIENKNLFWNGIIIGLLLSTRNVYAIPYVIVFLFALKNRDISIKNTIIIGIIAVLTFVATFLPFVIGHFEDFLKMNPFIIQSSYLMPFEYSFGCIILSFLSFFVVKNRLDVYFYSAVILFITIALHFVWMSIQHGMYAAFFNSKADISYFILCTPFFFFYILSVQKKAKISI